MSAVKEPLFHVVKRDNTGFLRGMLVRLTAIVLGLIVCAVIIVLLTGMNPLSVYAGLWDGAMGTTRRMWITLRDSAILLCIGFAVMPAFRMRFWNTGAEGQVLVGALATAAVMIYGVNLPTWLLYTLCPLAGIAAGMLWGIVPAFFKARWNTNETLFTLMLNYIATQLVAFCIIFWEKPKGSNSVGLINVKGKIGWLPKVLNNDYLLPIIIVVILAVILFIYMRYTKQGYEVAVVGESENTAHYAGIKVSRVIIRTMAICGGIAGIAGYLLTAGVGHTISTGTADGRGFTAIIVAWLGKLNPFSMMLVAFFLVFMQKGSIEIASQFNLNENASEIITGVLLFFILGCEFFINYRLEFRKSNKGEEALKA
ncbi:MAG: ABC transporter permease [Clostridia bacterium]|nr:ABC transporter permease [Clostridia bacterium]